jgi:hypothetical protein
MCLTHKILRVFINLLDENVFQNPQISCKTLRLFPEQSTLVLKYENETKFVKVSTVRCPHERLIFIMGSLA